MIAGLMSLLLVGVAVDIGVTAATTDDDDDDQSAEGPDERGEAELDPNPEDPDDTLPPIMTPMARAVICPRRWIRTVMPMGPRRITIPNRR